MSQLSTTTPDVHLHDGKLTTSSLNIAKVFGKEHKHVMRDVRNLEIPEDFSQSNFGLSDFKCPRGKTYPMYEITRDGFTLLVMGFTGAKAMQFKLSYIAAFNQMEAQITTPSEDMQLNALAQQLIDTQQEALELYRFKVKILENTTELVAKRRPFSEEESQQIFHMWQGGKSNREIANAIGRPVESIASKVRVLRLANRADNIAKQSLSLQLTVQGDLS